MLNLVVLKAAVRRPDGDAVQFDLRPGSANPVFRQLRRLGLDGRGSVMVDNVDADLTEAEPTAVRPKARHGEIAPVWEMVEARIRAGGVWSGRTPTLYHLGVRPVASLIDSPNLFSVVVAVLAAVVGVVSLTESRANALIGVFISVTTIPAAAALGLSLAYQSWNRAGGSALQLLLNVGLLILVGAAALRIQRLIWRPRARRG